MTILVAHDRRKERILRRYFDSGRRHWGRWLLFCLLATVVLLTTLALWADTVLLARSYAPSWFPLQAFDNLISFIKTYAQGIWIWLQELGKIISIPKSILQWFSLDESNQALFVWGIVFPIATFVVYLLIWALLAVTAAILRWVTPWNNEGIFTEPFLTDDTVDQLLKKRIESLKQYAYRKLNLTPNELVMQEPLVIQAPVLWYRQGVTSNDLLWRIGKDGKPRFGVYRVLILYLTDAHLCIYSCYYNLIKGVITHESLEIHLYREVAGASLAEFEDDIVLKLRSGRRVKLRRQFRIDFTNGEKLTMTIDGSRLSQEVGVSGSPQLSGAEKAYRVLNQVLTEQARGEEWAKVDKLDLDLGLVSTALRFFEEANFKHSERESNKFLLTPEKSHTQSRLREVVYTQIIADAPLTSEDVRAIEMTARQAYGGTVEDRLAFIVVGDTPETAARFQIYTFRAESGFTIILLSHAQLRQALLDNRAAEVLEEQIRLYWGEIDLYPVSTPITDVLSFFGRGPLINNILNDLNQGHHVGIFGLRKLGKTSLIWQLRERLRQQTVAYLDLQTLERDVASLYRQMLAEWRKDILFKYPNLLLPKLLTEQSSLNGNSPTNEYSTVEKFQIDLFALHKAVAQIEPKPNFLLILDEVGRILPTSGTHEVNDVYVGFRGYEALLATLRGVAQQKGFLTLLVASVEPVLNRTDRWGNVDNPMYRFFQEIFLPPFDESECNEMVTNIGHQMGIDYTVAALARIYAETGGHPFLTRSLCSLIIHDLPRPVTVDVAEVMAGIEKFTFQPNSYLESLWEERLDGDDHALLRQLATEEPLTREVLLADPTTRRVMTQRLGTLTEHHLLRYSTEGYRIAFALLRRWVRYQELGMPLEL